MLALFKSNDFVRLWAAGGASSTIRWLDILAVGVFAYQATHSALLVSLLLFLRLLPMFLFGILVGAVAERVNRRRLMMGMTAILGATYFGLGCLAYSGPLTPALLAFGSLVSGICWAIEIPVRRTMLMEVAGQTRIGSAMGLEVMTQNVTRILGPALGGMLLDLLGIFGAYWFESLLCAGSVIALAGVSVGGGAGADAKLQPERLLADLRDGLRYARSDRLIAAVLFCTVAVNLFGIWYIALVPVIGESHLRLSASLIGALMSAEGAGAFLGGFLIAIFGQPRCFRQIFLGGSALFISGVLAFSLANTFSTAIVALLLGGMGVAGFSSMQSTLLLSQARSEFRNRVMGALTFCIGFGPLGVLNAGFLANAFGARMAIMIIGALGLLSLAYAALHWPELRQSARPV